MKLLFIIPTMGNGGAERVITLISNELVQQNEVSVFCIENEGHNDYGLKDSVVIKSVGFIPRRGSKLIAVLDFAVNFRRMRRQIADYITEYRPDIVFSVLPKADFITYTIRNIGDFKWISSERNDPWVRSCFERELLKWIYRRCDCFVCQTKAVRNFYSDARVPKVSIIPNPVVSYPVLDDKDYRKQYGRFVVAIGRLDRQKNYGMLIDAFAASITKVAFTYKLLIIGDGVLRADLQKKINALGMQEYVLLLGRKSNVQDYIAYAEFFVMSSDYEGMPNALLEAMNGNLPVICTDIRTGAAKDLIDDSNGYLVAAGDAKEMSKALISMMTLSDEVRRQMGDSSHRKVDELKIDNIIQSWEKLFSELVN